jgi:hypothetical protein
MTSSKIYPTVGWTAKPSTRRADDISSTTRDVEEILETPEPGHAFDKPGQRPPISAVRGIHVTGVVRGGERQPAPFPQPGGWCSTACSKSLSATNPCATRA